MHGIDIRNYGSGNAGTTNALRTLGRKAGALTLLGDAFKCVIAIWSCICSMRRIRDIVPLLGIYAGAGSILGHNFPIYLGFQGGKGIAASVGLVLALDWRLIVAALGVFSACLLQHITFLCVLSAPIWLR